MKYILLALSLLLSYIETNGQSKFQKIFRGIKEGSGYGLIITQDNNYVIAGDIQNTNNGLTAGSLLKTDSTGNIIWSKTYKTSFDLSFSSMEQTSDGGFILFGLIANGIAVIKTDSNGAKQWAKLYNILSHYYLGSIKQTKDRGYIITAGGSSSLLLKIDSLGNTTWSKRYSGGSNTNQASNCVHLTNEGGYIFFGGINYSPGDEGYLIATTDSIGNIMWAKVYSVPFRIFPSQMTPVKDGGFIATGYKFSGGGGPAMHLFNIDSSGGFSWGRTFTGGIALSVQQTDDSGYILSGMTDTSCLIKTNSLGIPTWSKTYRGTGFTSFFFSVRQNKERGFLAVGMDGVYGKPAAFLVKTDSLGNSGCNENTFHIADSAYSPTISSPTLNAVSVTITSTDIIDTMGTGVVDSTLCSTLSVSHNYISAMTATIYPNPTSGLVNIRSSEAIERIQIYDVRGAVLYSALLNMNNVAVDLQRYPRGVYFYSITSVGGRMEKGKIVLR